MVSAKHGHCESSFFYTQKDQRLPAFYVKEDPLFHLRESLSSPINAASPQYLTVVSRQTHLRRVPNGIATCCLIGQVLWKEIVACYGRPRP